MKRIKIDWKGWGQALGIVLVVAVCLLGFVACNEKVYSDYEEVCAGMYVYRSSFVRYYSAWEACAELR